MYINICTDALNIGEELSRGCEVVLAARPQNTTYMHTTCRTSSYYAVVKSGDE